MNSSLNKLVKNMSDEDFKYLIEEFGSDNLELLNQKDAYPYEYMNSVERFNEEKLPTRKLPTRKLPTTKKEKLVMMVKYQTVT